MGFSVFRSCGLQFLARQGAGFGVSGFRDPGARVVVGVLCWLNRTSASSLFPSAVTVRDQGSGFADDFLDAGVLRVLGSSRGLLNPKP